MYLDAVKRQFAEMNARTHVADTVIPCAEQEIAQLERQYQLTLPAAYREFLLWMGKGAGNFLAGDACFYDALPQLREFALDLLAESGAPLRLPDDAFVFSMHDGYQFLFFRASEGANPPAYWYGEGEPAPADGTPATAFPRRFDHYSDFLVSEIVGHEQAYNQIAALKAASAQRQHDDAR
ncbi:MAG TPA: SMI1/KNR4 family protein [Ktedonobacterales bacterium]|nr:SMI1/KNR4 family protein [Ktedonobacterales bacterium]